MTVAAAHDYHMMRGRGRVLENAEIAADRHDAIYARTLAAIEHLRLGRVHRDAPPGDLFLLLHRHRRNAFPSTGCPHLAQTVVSVIGDGGHVADCGYRPPAQVAGVGGPEAFRRRPPGGPAPVGAAYP